MRASALGFLLALIPLPLAPQAIQVHSENPEFSYSLPADWERIVPNPPQAEQQPKEPQNTPEAVKKGIACMQMPLTARHGKPSSAIVVVALPFECFGQRMTEKDLVDFGSGVTDGLKLTFDFLNPVAATYRRAGHKFWIERVKAVPKGQTAPVSTVEIACTILKRGAACWMVQAADATGLEAFESGALTLEGSRLERLVPAEVFVKSPPPAKPRK